MATAPSVEREASIPRREEYFIESVSLSHTHVYYELIQTLHLLMFGA